jgi:hypothetical protein
MRYGIVIPGGEPTVQCELAQAAEEAGWDGKYRNSSNPFDIVSCGRTPKKNPQSVLSHVKSLGDAGATWWLEEMWSLSEKDLQRIEQGPPAY